MSQFSKGLSERRLAFIDRNKELWLCPVLPAQSKGVSPAKYKLHTQVGTGSGRQCIVGSIDDKEVCFAVSETARSCIPLSLPRKIMFQN